MLDFVEMHPYLTVFILFILWDVIPKITGYICKTIMICTSIITGHDVQFLEKDK